jgi:hypothetical protein
LTPAPNPRGRLDLALLRLAETVTRKVESATGLSLWDGEDGLAGVMRDKVRELRIPTEALDLKAPVSMRSIAEQAGFIKRRRAARKAVK